MSGFLPALVLLGFVLVLFAVVYALHLLVRIAPPAQCSTPFTGGLPQVEHALSRYHARWYTLTMLFLAFDMEMIFMYPWTRVITAMGASGVIEMFAFLAVLLAGVVYAWREGVLRWA
jgi:NADH-quinone oxidoreductase subunit A